MGAAADARMGLALYPIPFVVLFMEVPTQKRGHLWPWPHRAMATGGLAWPPALERRSVHVGPKV